MIFKGLGIIGLYIICTLVLYFMGVKKNWNFVRSQRGLVKEINTNPPGFSSKCFQGNRIYKNICGALFLKTFILSAMIFFVFILVANIDLSSKEGVFRAIMSCIIVYGIFFGITDGSEINDENISDPNKGIFKIFFRYFNSLKKDFICTEVNKEYQIIREGIDQTILDWYNKSDNNNEICGYFVIRVWMCIRENISEDLEVGIKDWYSDCIYDVYDAYITKNDLVKIDKIRKLISDETLKKININICEITDIIRTHQDKITRKKVIDQMRNQIKPVANPSTQNVDKDWIKSRLG